MPKLTEQHKLVLSAALAFAIGAGGMAVVAGDDKPTPDEVAKDVGSKLDPSLVVDTAKYHAAIQAAKESAGPDAKLVDLLSPPVEPGAQVTTGGNFPKGARLVGDVLLTGPAEGAFGNVSVTYRDDDNATWVEITATNTSSTTRRLTALVEYEVP